MCFPVMLFITTAGVRQVDFLSSTLFGIYIFDFPSLICEAEDIGVASEQKYINCLLFADDIVLIGNFEKIEL